MEEEEMRSNTTVVTEWSPILKVTGERIKLLFEVESTDTVKKYLKEMSVPVKFNRVRLEDILAKWDEDERKGMDLREFKGSTATSKLI
ncbi:hypothetical protein [Ekhidna sp.]